MQTTGVSRNLEIVAEFHDAWPSGIAVSRAGRIFISFPRIGDAHHAVTLGEVRGQAVVPYPDEISNDPSANDIGTRFTSIHGIAMAPGNRLLAIDTGSPAMDRCDPEAAALYLIDLDHDAIARRYTFAHGVVLPTSYLNDVVVDYNRGESGTAYISDSGPSGPNGIVCVDLDTGRSWRRLSGHPSVRAAGGAGFTIAAEGRPLAPSTVGIDGITLSPDAAWVWYTTLAGYGTFRVPSALLGDPTVEDTAVAAAVEEREGRDFACDGIDCDREGRIYFTDVTNNAIVRLVPDQHRFERILHDDRLVWPDAVALGPDRILYVTSSQINRAPEMTGGADLRERPFLLMRAASDADPATY